MMTKNNQTRMSIASVRLTGLLYLLVIICAGFSQGYVRGTLVVSGDALATANNILNNEALFRLGLTTDVIAFLVDAIISVMFYQIFRPYGKTLALVSSALRLLAHPAIASLNLLNHYMALQVTGGAEFMSVFSEAQLQSLSLMFMEAHRYGYLIAGVFFGLHCLLLGIQIHRSNVVPRIFGILMIGAALGYLMESFGDFNFPGNEAWLALVVGMTAALGEVSLTFFMLIKGVTRSYKNELKNTLS